MAPDYAEGYNKRATVHYLMKDFRGSIADCEKVVELQARPDAYDYPSRESLSGKGS